MNGRIAIQVGEQQFKLPPDGGWIGRGGGAEVDVTKLDVNQQVSRRHLWVSCDGSHLVVEDRGSTNGTFLPNGDNLARRPPTCVQSGVVLRLGSLPVTLELLPAAPIKPPEPDPAPDPGGPPGGQSYAERVLALLAGVTGALTRCRRARGDGWVCLAEGLQALIEQLVTALPGAHFGQITRCVHGGERLLAHFPPGDYPSRALLAAGLRSADGFLWDPDQGRNADTTLTYDPSTTESGKRARGSGVYVPLHWDGETQGALCLESERSGALTDLELSLCRTLAGQLAPALACARLQEKLDRMQLVQDNFARLVSQPVLEEVWSRREQLAPAMKLRDMTLLFCDMRGFLIATAGLTPDDTTRMVSEYLGALLPVVETHGGLVDKFLGDGLMAVFLPPEHLPPALRKSAAKPDEDAAVRATHAALDMQDAAQQVSERRRQRGEVTCPLGVGLHSGAALIGFSGTAERLEHTVMGEIVSWASRICAGADEHQTLLSPDTYARVQMSLAGRVRFNPTLIDTKHEGTMPVYAAQRRPPRIRNADSERSPGAAPPDIPA